MFIIELILLVTGLCAWVVILAIVGGFVAGMIRNMICEYQDSIKAERMAKRRVKQWVLINGNDQR